VSLHNVSTECVLICGCLRNGCGHCHKVCHSSLFLEENTFGYTVGCLWVGLPILMHPLLQCLNLFLKKLHFILTRTSVHQMRQFLDLTTVLGTCCPAGPPIVLPVMQNSGTLHMFQMTTYKNQMLYMSGFRSSVAAILPHSTWSKLLSDHTSPLPFLITAAV
jgi:hypothetical protein